jgi:hypothetical protein
VRAEQRLALEQHDLGTRHAAERRGCSEPGNSSADDDDSHEGFAE